MSTSIISYIKLAGIYAKGILAFRRREYDLQFVYDDNVWYIEAPVRWVVFVFFWWRRGFEKIW